MAPAMENPIREAAGYRKKAFDQIPVNLRMPTPRLL
jgi:hypothetical protein